MSSDHIPAIINEVGFDFSWSEEKVWALDLPIEEMMIDELEWHFAIPFWWTNGQKYNFEPRWVIENPDKYPERYKRIMAADSTYPLDIMHRRGRWLLLDGLHRLVKAKLLGKTTVKVRKVPVEMIDLIKLV